MIRVRYLASLSLLLIAPAASGAELRFVDRTVEAGLDFAHAVNVYHRSGPMCAGGAVGDFNSDGFPDLYLVGGGDVADALYINNGDGTFTDRAAEWGVALRHRGVAATVADFDGDGDDDVYVTSFGELPALSRPGAHRLWRNDGGRMVDVAAKVGVAYSTTINPDGYGAAFGDYDRDGDLDLFIGGWHGAPSLGSRLLRNNDGAFTDVTTSAGLTAPMHAFGAVWADMDGDSWPELIAAGDFGTARYFRNRRDGTFADLDPGTGAELAGDDAPWSVGRAHNGMGITVGDFDRDGRDDWFLTAIWPAYSLASPFWGNGLYNNAGAHRFVETASSSGVADGGWGWGTVAVDFDHDGWLDIAMTNGWPDPDPVTGDRYDGEPGYLFRNRGDAVFEEIHAAVGLVHAGEGRTLLNLDYDRDGDMDLVVLSNDEPARLFRNELITDRVPDDAHWLQVRLDTTHNPRFAPHGAGAKITVAAGGVVQTRQVVMGGTYLGQGELVAHFGVGGATRIDRLEVDFGDGKVRRIADLAADQRITVLAPCPPSTKPLWRPGPQGCPATRPAQPRAERTYANHDSNHKARNRK